MYNRREFVKILGISGILATGGFYLLNRYRILGPTYNYSNFDPRVPTSFVNQLKIPKYSGGIFGIVDSPSKIPMKVMSNSIEIFGNSPTGIWNYEIERNGENYTNPLIKLKKGDNFSTTLVNEISQKTIIHWHGLHLDWKNDGHPIYAVDYGENYDYNFTISNRGGTYWYHPHPMGLTAGQVYMGLVGLLIVEDDEEENLRKSLDLELGTTDIPIVIQDRRFNEDGEFIYNPNQMEQFMGFLGDVILVNLTPTPYLNVDTRVYRFRILNGSNARIYRLAFTKDDERQAFYLIGTDGGLLENPLKINEVFIAPGERIDLLLDLREFSSNDKVFLRNLGFYSMSMMGNMGRGMMGGMASGSLLADGEEFYILKLVVQNKIDYNPQIPDKLSSIERFDVSNAIKRQIVLSPSMMRRMQMMGWLINGYSYDLYSYPIQVSKNSKEIWEISNVAMGHMSMPHPMHIHAFQFYVIERKNSPPHIQSLAVDDKGKLPTDLGWKDTVLVWPGEQIKIAINFSHKFSNEQIYLFHCHNLEHHDGGMMINYKVI